DLGQIDGSRSFSSTGDNRIVINQGIDFFDGDNSFTFSFWIYPNYQSDAEWESLTEGQVFYKSSSIGLSRLWRQSFFSPGEGRFQPDIRFATYGTTYLNVVLYRQQWTYVTYSYDGNYLRAYRNDQLAQSANIGGFPLIADSSSFYFGRSFNSLKGQLDEFRILDTYRSDGWVATEYYNQFSPITFFNISSEQYSKPIVEVDVSINAIDLYGNSLPNVTISMYQFSNLIETDITDSDGKISFSDIIAGEYNFTASIYSNIADLTEVVNITSKAMLFDQPSQTIDLVCDVGSHFFEVIDIDGVPLESGWIMVGNDTHTIKKCNIGPTGHTQFWWVDAPPSEYNYTLYYNNPLYNPSTLTLASGDITTVNETIYLQVDLTTVEFTVQTINAPITPVSGAKLKLTVNDPLGASVVNLTTDINGKASLRWLNSSGIGGDYSLQIEFFGVNRLFNETNGGPAAVYNVSFTVSDKNYLEFRISIDLSRFQTELISLNPTDYIEIGWGSLLKLRTLFNVSKVETGYESLLGPATADSMTYEMLLEGITIQSGLFNEEFGSVGRHYVEIDTKEVDSDEQYIIIISAHKSGFTIPSNLILQLNILNNEVQVNQSDNDDSALTTYWSESVNMTLNTYGTNSEKFSIENALFQNVDHEFNFLISDVQNQWNLSKVVFNIYGISWNTDIANINITIADPYGAFIYTFDNNTDGWDYTQGSWTGITIILNSASRNKDNNFEFIISGTFDGSVDIVADAFFIRDTLSTQYLKFNVSKEISILTEIEGWAINTITFEIENCYYTSNWSAVDLSSLKALNFTANDGFTYSLDVGYSNGTGLLTIDDRIINPIGNQFLFKIESTFDLVFNTVIKVNYVQGFYVNQFMETYNLTTTDQGITNGGTFQLSALENSWNDQGSYLWVTGITDGISYFYPSDVGMTITIESQTYVVSDFAQGTGRYNLAGLTKNQVMQATIETSTPVNFSLSLSIKYFRQISYEIISSLSYSIVEVPSIFGTVNYDLDQGYYLKTITTSQLDADEYTVRFSLIKDHYKLGTKDLDLIVINRPTLLNNSPEFFRTIENIYVNDALNFTIVYTDTLTGSKLNNLRAQYYIWESYDQAGNVNETGQGNIISTIDNTYIVDFDTEMKQVGEYLLVLTMDKDNYDRKNGMILLTIKKRVLNYSLGANFENYRSSVAQGRTVLINISLTDPTQGGIPLINATVKMTIGGNIFEFIQSTGNVTGSYTFELRTDNINTFLGSETLTGIINITRRNYISEEFTIIIIVKMEEIFLGIPTFYFILLLSAIIALVGSIGGYKVYQNAKIPMFVKRVREMEKAIKKDKVIPESVLYHNKNVFIAERVNYKWEKLGLSLGNVMDTEGVKIKKISRKERRISGTVREHKIHPLGLLLMKWDERIGTEILAKYPEETVISEKTLMQIYSTHEYSGEKGIITLTAGSLNIVSYYSGPEIGHYLLLILNLDDDPDLYEGGMADTLRILLENKEDDAYFPLMPSLFQRLSLFPTLTDEQILALSYQDGVKHTIINNLRDIGLITKSELAVWLKDKFVHGFLDLDSTLSELLKKEFIKQVSVKGVSSDLIVLINDIFMIRIPPVDIYKDPVNRGLPKQLTKEYLSEVKQFFQSYYPTEEDNTRIVDILINPDVYQILRLLRTKVTTRDDLEKLRIKGVEDIYGALKLLFDAGMIKVLQDEKKNEYYALLTDFYVDLIFPKYLLKVIKMAYEQKSVTNTALIEYLKILEEIYFELKSK
ncbi:MAG: LamG domain-containing protein, partial [Promethearchaeota archaeon]